MNARQFLAVIILFVALSAYILYASKRKQDKARYQTIMNERFRVAISNVEIGGPIEVQKMEMKGKPRGFSWQEMVIVDSLWLLEKNGNVDERSGEHIPDWFVKKLKKQYNTDY